MAEHRESTVTVTTASARMDLASQVGGMVAVGATGVDTIDLGRED